MATRRYALERGGPKELELRWGFRKRDFEVSFRGSSWKLDRSQLKAGTTLVLPDGSSLLVRWVPPRWYSVAERESFLLDRDGVPVPGSDGDPRVLGRGAGWLVMVFALLRLLNLVGLAMDLERGMPVVPAFVAVAVSEAGLFALGVLALLGKRLPVALAAGILAAEVPLAAVLDGPPNPLWLIIQILVVVRLVRAWRRMAPREKRPSLAQVFE